MNKQERQTQILTLITEVNPAELISTRELAEASARARSVSQPAIIVSAAEAGTRAARAWISAEPYDPRKEDKGEGCRYPFPRV